MKQCSSVKSAVSKIGQWQELTEALARYYSVVCWHGKSKGQTLGKTGRFSIGSSVLRINLHKQPHLIHYLSALSCVCDTDRLLKEEIHPKTDFTLWYFNYFGQQSQHVQTQTSIFLSCKSEHLEYVMSSEYPVSSWFTENELVPVSTIFVWNINSELCLFECGAFIRQDSWYNLLKLLGCSCVKGTMTAGLSDSY